MSCIIRKRKDEAFVVDFKNGTRRIVCIHIKAKSAEVVELPHSFQFDEQNRSILVPIHHRASNNKFELPAIKNTPYTAKEVMDMLAYQEEYWIKGISNQPYFE